MEFQHDHSLASLGAKTRDTKMVLNCYCWPFVQKNMRKNHCFLALFRGIYTMFLASFFSSASFLRHFWRQTTQNEPNFSLPPSQFYWKQTQFSASQDCPTMAISFTPGTGCFFFFFTTFFTFLNSWFKSSVENSVIWSLKKKSHSHNLGDEKHPRNFRKPNRAKFLGWDFSFKHLS